MRLLRPHVITDAMLISSSLSENDYPEWKSTTTYAIGDYVMRASLHKVFRRLVAGQTPTAPESDPVTWLDSGPTNKWAPFDDVVGTLATGPSPLTYTLSTGFTDSLALFELHGRYVDISVKDGAGGKVVYSRTIDLEVSYVEDIYDWFFGELDVRTDLVLTDLPGQYGSSEITVTVRTITGPASLGVLKPGLSTSLGETQYGARVGIDDYSRKDRDEFGNVTILQRAYSKRGSFTLETSLGSFNKIFRLLADVRATPCVYIGTEEDGYEPLLIYGFFTSFDIEVTYPDYHLCSLEIEGLI